MLNYQLVHLIQYHSDTLAAGLLRQVQSSKRAGAYCQVSPLDLRERVHDIYHHLGEWLTDKSESDIEERYTAIGIRRRQQTVPLSELVWVIILTKNQLREFINDAAFAARAAEPGEKEQLLQLIDNFFDHAIYAAVAGYQNGAEMKAKPEAVGLRAS
jgi:hypothetical protein